LVVECVAPVQCPERELSHHRIIVGQTCSGGGDVAAVPGENDVAPPFVQCRAVLTGGASW
jgi:hypothetical protein